MTNPRKIIFCYDEGLDEKQILNECIKCKNLGIKFGIEVGYVMDRQNKWLHRGSKDSPSDLGKEVWLNLVENCIEYV